jgi:hypothetical protein
MQGTSNKRIVANISCVNYDAIQEYISCLPDPIIHPFEATSSEPQGKRERSTCGLNYCIQFFV